MALLSPLVLTESNFLPVSRSDKHLIMKTVICSERLFSWAEEHTTRPINRIKKPVLKSQQERNINNKHVLTTCRIAVPMATISLTAHLLK